MDIQNVANDLIHTLLEKGFKVQRHDAYSTNSIYLKLDYGMACSIRISDHPGKSKLKYRFNLITTEDELKETVENNLPRYFYGLSYIQKLIDDIIEEKQIKINKYGGIERYESLMERNYEKGKMEKGFWQHAEEYYLTPAGKIMIKPSI